MKRARRLPPHVQAALAKRRGTAKQRKLALDAQAPHGPRVTITEENYNAPVTLSSSANGKSDSISKPRNSEP